MRTLGVGFLLAAAAAAQGRGPVIVEVAQAVERDVAARRAFVGSVVALRTSTVGSEVDGRVDAFLAEEGMRVEEGDVLARLRPRLAEIRLAAAQAAMELRQAELLELRNGARPEEIEQAAAQVRQAEAALEVASWKYVNAQRLETGGTISPDALRDALLVRRSAEERVREMRAALQLLEEGTRAERIAQATASVSAQQAEVDRLQEELDRHVIRAPFAGYVLAELTEVGEWLGRGGAVARIAALDTVEVVVPVLEDYVTGLRMGMKIPVRVDAFPERTFDAELVAIVPQADLRARTFPVKLRIANPREGDRPVLRAGMFARAHIEIGEKVRAVLVPKDALVLGGPKPVVWVVSPERTAAPVPVEIGLAFDGEIQVTGVEAGQTVVVRGNERLLPGASVRTAGE